MPTERGDLLRGTLEMLILRSLDDGPMHGYGITERLQRVSDVLTVEEMPPTNPREENRQRQWLGLEVASLLDRSPAAEQLKATLGVTGTVGVLVLKVVPDSPADAAGIRPGDVLEAVDDFEISDLETYRRLRAQLAGRNEPLRFRVRTGSVENYIEVQPGRRGLEQ